MSADFGIRDRSGQCCPLLRRQPAAPPFHNLSFCESPYSCIALNRPTRCSMACMVSMANQKPASSDFSVQSRAAPYRATCWSNFCVACVSANDPHPTGGACAMVSPRKRKRKTAGPRIAPLVPMPMVQPLSDSDWQPFLELLPSRSGSEIFRRELNGLLMTDVYHFHVRVT